MKKNSKILCTFLAVLMVLTAVTMTASAAETITYYKEGYYTYRVNEYSYSDETSAVITDVDTAISGNITVPATLGGHQVQYIPAFAYENCTKLTGVTVGNNINYISTQAFSGCTGLKEVYIGDSVNSIGSHAFYNCSALTTVHMGKKVNILYEHAFDGCTSLSDVYYRGSVKDWNSMYERYFYGMRLSSADIHFEIPHEMKYERGDVFYFGSYPQSIVEDTALIEQLNGNKDNWTYIEDTYKGIKYAEIELDGEKYRARLDGTFENAVNWFLYEPVLWKVKDPANGLLFAEIAVDRRDYGGLWPSKSKLREWLNNDFYSQAFSESEQEKILTTTVRGDGIDTYDWSYVSGNDTTETIFIPSAGELSNAILGYSAYLNSSNSARQAKITDYAMNKKTEKNETYPLHTRLVTTEKIINVLTDGALGYYSVSNLGVRPAMYTDIESIECSHYFTKTVTAPGCLDGGYTTYTCKCGYSYVSDHTEATGHIYESEIIDPTCAAQGYTRYTCVCGDTYDSDYVDIIDHSYSVSGFCYMCHKIAPVITGTCGDSSTWTLDTATGEMVISGTGRVWQDETWSGKYNPYIKSIIVSEGITEICTGAFRYCESVTSVSIPASVENIGYNAFSYSLEELNIDEGNAVYSSDGKVGLLSKDKTEFLMYYGAAESYTIPDGVTSIGNSAFYNCDALTDITIPGSVTSIGNYAFSNCDALTDITIPGSVTSIGNYAFRDCDALTNVTIKYGVGSIENDAFYSCDALTTITIPDSVTKLTSAFSYCDSITDIYYMGTQEQWYKVYGSYSIECENIHFHDHDYAEEIIKAPDHKEEGLRILSCNNCDKVFEEAMAVIPHNYVSRTAAYATHLKEGLRVYTCSCGDTYDEVIPKIEEHYYNSYVTTPATHTSTGIRTYTCECGDTYTVVIPAREYDHTFVSEITKEPTHSETGIRTYTCACGKTYTETVAKIPHSYNKVVTAPTCTEYGYTTYICSCGVSYVSDYVGTKPHSYTSEITTPATHLSEGVMTYTCSACGNTYTEAIAKTQEHSYTVYDIIEPDCKNDGYTVYVCECGNSYEDDFVSATGHNYDGDTCVNCGKSKVENCSCNCHKGGISGIIWKILRFFYKLFGMKKYCACGVTHY